MVNSNIIPFIILSVHNGPLILILSDQMIERCIRYITSKISNYQFTTMEQFICFCFHGFRGQPSSFSALLRSTSGIEKNIPKKSIISVAEPPLSL
jgi:hypothetical protein